MRKMFLAALAGAVLAGPFAGSVLAERFAGADFSVEVPEELLEMADVEVSEDGIAIFEKLSRENFGGRVGRLTVFESPADYGFLPSFSWAGELSYPDGRTLQLVWVLPSDVQTDLQNETAREHYQVLRGSLEEIERSIQPVGEGEYLSPEEVNHTEVYGEVLALLREDLLAEKDEEGMEADGFSPLYAYDYGTASSLEKAGYVYVDMLGTGFPMLAVVQPDSGLIFDLFGQQGEEAVSLCSSEERDLFFFAGHGASAPRMVRRQSSSGAGVSETTFYIVDPMEMELYEQVCFLYDETKDPENPYFVQYLYSDPESLSLEEWTQRMENFGEEYQLGEVRFLSEDF